MMFQLGCTDKADWTAPILSGLCGNPADGREAAVSNIAGVPLARPRRRTYPPPIFGMI